MKKYIILLFTLTLAVDSAVVGSQGTFGNTYYDRIILKGEGLSSKEIIKIIEDNYKTKTHIIKEFIQHCVPEK